MNRKGYLGYFVAFWSLLCSGFLGAQHIGPATDNYVTTQRVLYNPAAIADPRPFADFRIVGVSQLLTNNYIYFPNASFTSEPLDNLTEGKRYNAYSETDILGPAYTQSWKNRAFGFNIRVRNHLIGRRVPSSIAKFAFEGLSYDPQQNIEYDEKRFYIKNMAWGELGLNYAQIIQKRGNVIITGGGSLKLLSGIANAALIAKEMRFEVDTSDLSLANYDGQMVFTVPGANKGFGLGLDLGVEYKRMIKDDNSFHIPHHRRGNCLVKEYKYKIGVSMLDLGYINFKQTTSNYKFDGDSISLTDYVSNPPDGISDITNAIDNAISASGAEVEKKDRAFATLPLTFMLQGDYNFENNFYLNAQLLVGMQQINFSGAERMSTFTITPRYELEKITVAMPLSFYRYGKPGLGFYARLWWLSFGTNNFVPILLKNDMYGADAYVSLNVPLFRSKDCRSFIQHKGDYCPKPKLKIFDLSKITGNKRKKKTAERKRYRAVKKSRRKAK